MSVDPIILKLEADISGLQKRLDQVEKKADKTASNMSKQLNNTFNKLGQRIAAVFAIDRIARFTKEAVKLAAAAEAIETAFNRLDNPQLLAQLQRATKGTVSDLELMKQAVRARNFEIPLQELGTLFEFARRRAAETGESVDYLVNSIVLGIGRKSPLILDNLGISAVRLRKELRGVGVQAADVGEITETVGRIASEALETMGEDAETTAISLAQVQARFENMQKQVGDALLPVVDSLLDKMEDLGLAMLANARIGIFDADIGKNIKTAETELDKYLVTLTKVLKEADDSELQELFTEASGEIVKINKEAGLYSDLLDKQNTAALDQINNLFYAREAQSGVFAEAEKTEEAHQGIVEGLKAELKLINELIEKETDRSKLGEQGELVVERERIRAQIKELTEVAKDEAKKGSKEIRDELFGFLEGEDLLAQRTDLEVFEANVRMSEEAVTDIYEAALAERDAKLDEFYEKRRAKREADRLADQEYWQATGELANSVFAAIGALMSDSANSQKEFAIAQALINTFLAITNALTKGDYPLNLIKAAAVGAAGFAQVAKIQNQQVPRFFEGEDFVQSPSRGQKRDDVHAMLHHGEAVIPAGANKRQKGLAKAWIEGRENDWLMKNHVLPALLAQKQKMEDESRRQMTRDIFAGGFDDMRLVGQSKKTNRLLETIARNTRSGKRHRHG